jgi:hypothetical protein
MIFQPSGERTFGGIGQRQLSLKWEEAVWRRTGKRGRPPVLWSDADMEQVTVPGPDKGPTGMPERSAYKDNGEPLIPPKVSYGLLVILVGCLAVNIAMIWMEPDRNPYPPISGSAWLLFLHIAYSFRWHRRVSLTLQIVAWSLGALSLCLW